MDTKVNTKQLLAGENRKYVLGGVVAIFIIVALIGVKMYLTSMARDKVQETVANLSSWADIDYGAVSVSLLGLNLYVDDVTVMPANSREKFKIGQIVVYSIDDHEDYPWNLDVAFESLEIPLKRGAIDADTYNSLYAMGYKDKLFLNGRFAYQYDADNKEFALERIGFSIDNMGEIEAGATFGNVDLVSGPPIYALMSYPAFLLKEAHLVYKDDSFIDKFMGYQAHLQNKTLDGLKKEIIKDMEKQAQTFPDDDIRHKALLAAIDFVKSPDEISVTAAPQKPVTLARLNRMPDPLSLVKLLNLEVE